MMLPPATVMLFRRALFLWVAGFTVAAYGGWAELATMSRSPAFIPPDKLALVTHALARANGLTATVMVPVAAASMFVLALHGLLRRPRWWTSALVWFLYVNLMNKAWLAGSGGQQLIANLLFWNIFLGAVQGEGRPAFQGWGWATGLAWAAFWIVRLQLLLVYAATGSHKLEGVHWTSGSALGIVATDPAFGPEWVMEVPGFAKVMTWAVLAFQLSFPLAVWWRRTRIPWMVFGVIFHLGTALWMGIPEMAFAFLVAYIPWLPEGMASSIMRIATRTGHGGGPPPDQER